MTIDISDTHVLRGQEAIEALNNFVEILKTPGGSDLKDNQKNVLIKTAQALSQTIRNDKEHAKRHKKQDS